MLLLIDRKNEVGMNRWIDELAKRELPAVVLADGYSLYASPGLITQVAGINTIDIGISYNDGPLWKETYEEMVAWVPEWLAINNPRELPPRDLLKMIMGKLNDRYFSLVGKTSPVFGGKYFSYSEDTLQIAEEIGIKYVLSRGTMKEKGCFLPAKGIQTYNHIRV